MKRAYSFDHSLVCKLRLLHAQNSALLEAWHARKEKSGVNLFKFLANNTEDLRRVVACVRFLKIVERGF